MLRMAPRIATGLGLTEASGFCTYTPLTPDAGCGGAAASAGPCRPTRCRSASRWTRTARPAPSCPTGEIGHVCFQGPQNFLGYLNDPAATAEALSSDGWLYTGDMGRIGRARPAPRRPRQMGAQDRRLPGLPRRRGDPLRRARRPGGQRGRGGPAARLWSEGIVAFVEKRPGAELTEADLRRHARSLTSYMRPLHYVILEPGAMPLNRTAKVDTVRLQEMAKEEVARLRERGRWDSE